MFQRYNIRDYTTLMEIEKSEPQYSASERKKFGTHKHELKSTVFKYYFFEGFFDNVGLSDMDMQYVSHGYSPVRISPSGEETRLFTVHHIKPLTCLGETKPSNLIPLPRGFHNFIHRRIIDPQISGMAPGDKKVLVAMPDFSKITLDMMMDSGFQLQYHKYVVDQYKMFPSEFNKHGMIKNPQFISNWYLNTFGPKK